MNAIYIRMLALLFTVMLGGGFQTISNISRKGLWACLLAMWLLVFMVGRTLVLRRLLIPAMPFLIWMVCNYIWGVLVSPIGVFDLALKLAFYFFLILGTVLILTSDREYLEVFASYVQWSLVLNLLVTLLLVSRPEYSRYLAGPGAVNYTEKILDSDRFAGLWGNANQAGFAALLMILISVWAKPLMGWVGRISAVTIIFLTASRQSTWLLVLITLLFLVMVAARSAKGRLVGVFAGLVIAASIPFMDASMLRGVSKDPRIARILDVTERETKSQGAHSRADWLKIWIPRLISGPWYGHGLAAMAGSDTPMIEYRTDVPFMGVHNLYLGLWADTGILGLLTFLAVVGRQVYKTLRQRYSPLVQWALAALIIVVLGDSFVKHSLLFDMDGMAAYSLLFLLPTSPALRDAELADE